jgi:hypothetical protein
LAEVRDAAIRRGMVSYCAECAKSIRFQTEKPVDYGVPDFLSDLFGGKK